MSYDLLLDIGSSGARMAILEGNRVQSPEVFPREENTEEWIRSLLASHEGASSLLAASTGLVRGGRVVSGSLGEIDLLRLAEEELRAPALVINDGHASALAAARAGYETPLLAVHIGTGMAAGLWGEDLWLGQSGLSGENPLSPGGALLEKTYEEITGGNPGGEEILRLARQEDKDATRAAGDMVIALADEILRMIYFADPATVVLSGGKMFEALQGRILIALEEALSGKTPWQQMLADRSIEVSPLGAWTPLYGAACLASGNPDFSTVL